MLETGSKKWHEMIFFRDSLRSHPCVAADYAEAKLELAAHAERLDTLPTYIEKDFWVCRVLDALYHGRPDHHPRLLFKGGTSLSKAFDAIQR